MLLAIETSCDETAVALFKLPRADAAEGTDVLLLADLISSQTKLHQSYGGVVPELASREHVKNLPHMVLEILGSVSAEVSDLKAIAVTRGPGLKGCLLVGVCYAKALALSLGIPLLPVHHIEGHMLAGSLMPEESRPKYPMIILVVSGGHTMLVYAEAFGKYRLLANTRDDAAGEAFDKCATLLGLPYPGGPDLSGVAEEGNPKAYQFPIALKSDLSSFSFSGLKTSVQRTVSSLGSEVENETIRNDLAASVQEAIVEALTRKTVAHFKQLQPKSVLLTGGVAANSRLRKRLAEELGAAFCVPDRRWCTDNAAMIGALAIEYFKANPTSYTEWNSLDAPQLLGPNAPIELGALARWPLTSLAQNEPRNS